MDVTLRKSVQQEVQSQQVKLKRALWSLSFNKDFFMSSEVAAKLVQGEPVPFNQNDIILNSLRLQGCLSFPYQSHYNSDEVLEIFNSISLLWYQDYYAHPLWNRLKSGQASRNQLIGWIMHNYHVSINAGITHARIASYTDLPQIKAMHQQSSMEEYWHADRFYFVRHPKLSLSDEAVKQYMALPLTHAFQTHLRELSRSNLLAYSLVSYFQERTIMFKDSCEDFYQCVEEQYQLDHYFDGWRKHIQLDTELGHSEHRADIVRAIGTVDHATLVTAINEVKLAIDYLHQALTEIADYHPHEDKDVVRTPFAQEGAFCPLAHPVHLLTEALKRQSLVGVKQVLVGSPVLATQEVAWLSAICESGYRALGESYLHDDIVLIGDLVRTADRLRQGRGIKQATANPRSKALTNLLLKNASHPARWLASVWPMLLALQGPFERFDARLLRRLNHSLCEEAQLESIRMQEMLICGYLDFGFQPIDPNFD